MKRAEITPQAAKDIQDSIAYYDAEQVGLGLRLLEALEAAYRFIQQSPSAGSTRYQHLLPVPTHMHVLKKFPFLVFYIERSDCIRIFRVLHASRDLPPMLQENVE